MRFLLPDIRLPSDVAEAATAGEKFGGLPDGLPAELWPKCKDCGKSQSFLAKLVHYPGRLDLGREGRVLFVFQCAHDPGMCSTWERGAGANAAFVVEPEALVKTPPPLPADEPPIENEVWIVGWQEREDTISATLVPAFYDDREFWALSDEDRFRAKNITRLGSVPYWVQNPSEAPPRAEGWVFLGQLEGIHSFLVPPRTKVDWVLEDEERWEGRTHYGIGPNFGDGGFAYLFLKPDRAIPQVQMFWQCG